MSKTTDEFFDSCQATRLLISNLETNMKVMGDCLSEEEQAGLMRVNLIVIRQCIEEMLPLKKRQTRKDDEGEKQ